MHQHVDDVCAAYEYTNRFGLGNFRFISATATRARCKLVSDVEIIRATQGDVDLSTTMSAFADRKKSFSG